MKLLSIVMFAVLASSPQVKDKGTSQPHPQCDLFYVTKSDLSRFRATGTPISSLSRSVNKVLKTSFDFANMLDQYTLGIASAVTLGTLLGTTASLEDIKPNAWNEVVLTGNLVYRDSPFTVIPVKAAKLDIQYEKKIKTLTTGAKGEYSGFFHEWVPFTRFRLIPNPVGIGIDPTLQGEGAIQGNERLVKTMDIPMKITVRSKVCQASTTLTRLPMEPITFIMTRK
jgi:hypothetical protein